MSIYTTYTATFRHVAIYIYTVWLLYNQIGDHHFCLSREVNCLNWWCGMPKNVHETHAASFGWLLGSNFEDNFMMPAVHDASYHNAHPMIPVQICSPKKTAWLTVPKNCLCQNLSKSQVNWVLRLTSHFHPYNQCLIHVDGVQHNDVQTTC